MVNGSLRWHCLGAIALGAGSVTAFAPLSWFPVKWLALAGLFALLCCAVDRGHTARRGALLAGAFGLALFLGGVSWIYVSLSVFGGMPPWLASLATLLFCATLATFPALAGALFVRVAPPGGAQRAFLFAGLWVLTEWLRGWLFTGFPWLAAGYSQTPPSPLAGYAPLLGVYGVSLCAALLAALMVVILRYSQLPRTGRNARLAAALAALALLVGAGDRLREVHWTQPVGDPFSVALLQGNVAQDIKWLAERFVDSLHTYHQLALANPAKLTILPETAIPALLDQVPADYLAEMRRLAMRQQGDLIFGTAVAEDGRYFNSAMSVGASAGQRYDKVHLVPFGEFVPAGFGWFLRMASIPMSDFSSGPPAPAPLRVAGQHVAVNICYEDAFGEELRRALPEASVLVNLSNVAWFGDSLAPRQHLQIAQMRALESGRMLLRATNTGMTAIVASNGNVQAVLPPFTRAALVGEVQGYTGATPFVNWGNWPAIGAALLLVALARVRWSR